MGARKGRKSFVWICKLLIPISFLAVIIQWSGWLYQVMPLLDPVMRMINLPGAAALPILSGMLIGPYTTIAMISVLPFSLGQMTLIAVFTMVAHSLIIESAIQHRSGIHAAKITLIRIGGAILAVLIVSQFFTNTAQDIVIPDAFTAAVPFIQVLKVWGIETGWLLAKIFGIVMAVMIGLESLKSLGWVENLIKIFRPVMHVLGLSRRAAMLWITAVLFGVLYGGAVIIEEAGRAGLSKGELEDLHISIGINHSMIEDPALYLALGLNAFWLWIPRLVIAIVAVQVFRVVRYLKGKYLQWQTARVE
ncbi:MAG: hypothetical protein PHY18_01165 [Dehalococcoidales bacterium]|nr:hypothetical protein [Dehalococcoidales bacterium]